MGQILRCPKADNLQEYLGTIVMPKSKVWNKGSLVVVENITFPDQQPAVAFLPKLAGKVFFQSGIEFLR